MSDHTFRVIERQDSGRVIAGKVLPSASTERVITLAAVMHTKVVGDEGVPNIILHKC